MESYADRYSYTSVIQNRLSGASVAFRILDAKYGYGLYRVFANAHSFEYFISTSSTHCLYDISYDPDYDGTIEYEEEFGVSNLTKCYYNMTNVIYQRLARGEEIGKELGCWFYVDLDDNLMVFWRAFKDVDDDSIELLGNGDSGCTFNEFEEDVANMPAMITKVLQEKQFA